MSLPGAFPNSTAFDTFAQTYDDDFTHSLLGQLLRTRVWEIFGQYFTGGQHILELTCGTGEDAVWLARRGVHVTATDGSVEMVKKAKAKAEAEGMLRESEESRGRGSGETSKGREAEAQGSRGDRKSAVPGSVEVKQVSLQEIIAGPQLLASGPFDGVFSNFGGLNTINEWRGLAAALAKIVRPGGVVVLVPMGPVCPWEICWYLAHGQPRTAFRRFSRAGVPAKIGGTVIPIWYPSARRLRADFAPWFQHRRTESLELWLPPSYLDHLVNRWPVLFRWLNQVEKVTARLTGGWGDHYIVIFERINH